MSLRTLNDALQHASSCSLAAAVETALASSKLLAGVFPHDPAAVADTLAQATVSPQTAVLCLHYLTHVETSDSTALQRVVANLLRSPFSEIFDVTHRCVLEWAARQPALAATLAGVVFGALRALTMLPQGDDVEPYPSNGGRDGNAHSTCILLRDLLPLSIQVYAPPSKSD